jgi:MFS family permease
MIDLRGLPRVYWILWTGALINRLGGFVMPLLALYLTGERGLPIPEVGFIIALLGAGTLCAGPAGGFLADHIGRRRTLVFALASGALAMLHLAFARAPAHIAAAAFLLGLFGDMYRPAVSAAISDLVAPEERVRAYGLLYWAVNFGFAVGAALGGLLSKHGWYLLFVGDAATTLIYAAIVWLRVPETQPQRHEHEVRPPLWAPLADRRFMIFVLLVTLVWMLFLQSFTTLPVDMRDHGVSPAGYGALIALNGLLIVLLQPFVSRVLGRFPRYRVLAGGAVLVGVGFGMTAIMRSIPGYALSIAVWSLGEIVMAGIGPAVTADAAPPGLRGAYQGVFQSGMGAAALLAPSLGSLVMAHFGSAALWTACAAIGFVSAAGQLALGAQRKAALVSSTAR